MRLRRLDLLRYGRFTDLRLELPLRQGEPDLHILFGPNEAGKSTSLSALEDLLFGIPARSPLNFLHDYAAMRLGAVLEGGPGRLEFRRRKGNRDTLLDPDEVPLPAGEGALASWLGGADRAFFERMFSLDHRRLREGGREILEAKDDVGQMLFSAGAGIAGLRERLAALKQEADDLWGPRRAARRAHAQAEERLKAAEAELRERTVTAGRWDELRRAERSASEAYAALEALIQERAAERSRLARIRRVHGDVGRKAALDARIAELGAVPPLPPDARERLENAERDLARAAARIEPAREQLEAAQAAHDGLRPDPALLARRDDVRQLRERRSEVRPERASLPKRRQELAAAEAQLQRLAAELDWPALAPDTLLARIPARPKLEALRGLLTRRGALAAARAAARKALQEAETRLAQAQRDLEDAAAPADTGPLAARLRALREGGDPAAGIAAAQARLAEAEAGLRRELAGLRPPVADAATLAALAVPPRAAVQQWRDRWQDLAQRRRACAERIGAAEAERDRHGRAAERIRRTEHAVAAGELAQARHDRDAGWSELRRRLLAGQTPAAAGLDAHEAAMLAADALADRRFDTAEAAARLAVTERQRAEQEEALEGLQRQAAALAAEATALEAEWRALWTALEPAPGEAEAMLDWLTRRDAILAQEGARQVQAQEIETLRRAEAAGRAALLQLLAGCGEAVEAWRDQPLRVVQEAASACQQRHERLAEARRLAAEEQRMAATELQRRQEALAEAEDGWTAWLEQWRRGAAACGLSGQDSPEAVEAQVAALAEMREIAIPADRLRQDRILKIERDIAAFEAEAASLAAALAPDLAGQDADAAVLELMRRLEAAEQAEAARTEKAREIAAAAKRLADCEAASRSAQEAIDDLHRLAGTSVLAALKAAIGRAEALRTVQRDRADLLQRLREQGDDLPLAQLEAECAEIEIDRAKAREDALGTELKELNERLLQARDIRTEAQTAFTAVGGADGAARAAADRQAALAEMQDVAERYVRTRSAALLLDWAIERYRQEKQAPLLARASGHFAMLTGGSFSELALEFDEGDRLQLTGRRPDGARVGIDGMSSGTADQLYLALRVAAVEDYLARAAPLPFIADDLFVNFDDARAEAGFRVLGQLAQVTQVIFFTHHRHLLEVARAALGPDLHCLSLEEVGISH